MFHVCISIARIMRKVKKKLSFGQVCFEYEFPDILHHFFGRLELVTVFQGGAHLFVHVSEKGMHIKSAMVNPAQFFFSWHVEVEL